MIQETISDVVNESVWEEDVSRKSKVKARLVSLAKDWEE